MTWAREIFVATKALGVYYTGNFTDPGVQPTWTAINTGLPTLDCIDFAIDPFVPSEKQYVLLDTNGIVSMRTGGVWSEIFSDADAFILTGGTCTVSVVGIWADALIPGRLWVSIYRSGCGHSNANFGAYSNDYGTSWTLANAASQSCAVRDCGYIRSYGDDVYIAARSTAAAFVHSSDDEGATWTSTWLDFSKVWPICFNKLQPARVYSKTDTLTTDSLCRVANVGGRTLLQNNMSPSSPASMWFHPTDANYHRMVRTANRLYVTDDSWATFSTGNAIDQNLYSFSPYGGSDTDEMLVGTGLLLTSHIIGTLYGEADVTFTGIAGTNVAAAPYVDSIPNICGGLASMGIQGVNPAFACSMDVYDVSFERTPATVMEAYGVLLEQDPAVTMDVGQVAFERES